MANDYGDVSTGERSQRGRRRIGLIVDKVFKIERMSRVAQRQRLLGGYIGEWVLSRSAGGADNVLGMSFWGERQLYKGASGSLFMLIHIGEIAIHRSLS